MKRSQELERHFTAIREIIVQMAAQRDDALCQVKEWDEATEIQKREEKITELQTQLASGFCPSSEQWEQVCKWEKQHSAKRHETSRSDQPQKMYPGVAHFSYSFSYTPIGTMGSVECEACRNKALEKSGGNYLEYQRLRKEYDVEFFIGEV